MAELLQPVEARLTAIVCEARGADGSLGTTAQGAAITNTPAPVFRPAADGGDLRDPAYPSEQFDRAVFYEWLGSAPHPGTNNPRQPRLLERYDLRILVGYVYGADAASFVATTGGETASTQVRVVRRRALSDARRLKVALEEPALTGGGTDPVLTAVRIERATVEDLRGGRLLLVLQTSVLVESTRPGSYLP